MKKLNNVELLKCKDGYIILNKENINDFMKYYKNTRNIYDSLKLLVEKIINRKLTNWEEVGFLNEDYNIYDFRKENLKIYKYYDEFNPVEKMTDNWYFDILEDMNDPMISEVNLLDILNNNTKYRPDIKWCFSEQYENKIAIKQFLKELLKIDIELYGKFLDMLLIKSEDILIKYPSYSWLNAIAFNSYENKVCIYIGEGYEDDIIELYKEALLIKKKINKRKIISGMEVIKKLDINIPEYMECDNDEAMAFLRLEKLKEYKDMNKISPVLDGYYENSLNEIKDCVKNEN